MYESLGDILELWFILILFFCKNFFVFIKIFLLLIIFFIFFLGCFLSFCIEEKEILFFLIFFNIDFVIGWFERFLMFIRIFKNFCCEIFIGIIFLIERILFVIVLVLLKRKLFIFDVRILIN